MKRRKEIICSCLWLRRKVCKWLLVPQYSVNSAKNFYRLGLLCLCHFISVSHNFLSNSFAWVHKDPSSCPQCFLEGSSFSEDKHILSHNKRSNMKYNGCQFDTLLTNKSPPLLSKKLLAVFVYIFIESLRFFAICKSICGLHYFHDVCPRYMFHYHNMINHIQQSFL